MILTADHGSRLAVHDLGGQGPAVLICHATGFCGRAYEPLAQELTPQFHVWAMDFPGHGDSDSPPNGDFSWLGMVRHLVAVTRAISPDRPLACVVGHSMGGAVALQAAAGDDALFAAAYIYEPPIVAMPVDASGPRTNPMADAARRRQGTFASKPAAMWRYASRPPLNSMDARSLAAYVDHGFQALPDGTVALKCSPENEARTFEAGGIITVETVAAAAVPTLCVSGGEQRSPLTTVVPALASALPNAELRIHRHLGHFGPLESPGLIGAEIAAHTRR